MDNLTSESEKEFSNNKFAITNNDLGAEVSVPKKRKKNNNENLHPLEKYIPINPLWLSVSEASKLGGVKTKTIRRAIQDKIINYKVVGNRYLIDFSSLLIYLHTKTKLKNKLNSFGIGQYIDKWKE